MEHKSSGFVLERDQKAIIEELTNEEAGIIFKAIYEYETTKQEPKLDKFLRIVFKQFKIKLDFYDNAYIQKCLINKENAEKRWQNKNATVCDRMQMDANKRKENKSKEKKIKENKNKVNKNINNNINIKNINKKESENNIVAVATTPTLEAVSQYGLELGIDNNYCERFFNHYESIGWVNGTGQQIKNWKLIFKNWIAKDKKIEKDNLKKVGEGVFKI